MWACGGVNGNTVKIKGIEPNLHIWSLLSKNEVERCL